MPENTQKYTIIKLFCGSDMLRSTSTTQGVIAVSSGESEFYALGKGASARLGAVSMLKDFGVDISENTQIDKAEVGVRIDASTGRGIAVRRGAGRIRHIATPTLRVQKLTQDGKESTLRKSPGVSNPPHLGTKHLDGGLIQRALERCHCYVRGLESRCGQKCGKSRGFHGHGVWTVLITRAAVRCN